MSEFSVIDLFAGAGGLSLGFVQADRYNIKVAFENNPSMQETYRRNHPGVDVRGDVCEANYDEIQEKYGKIDVVIGGPPCQGFSNANRQKSNAINKNNMLVKQYVRAILELQPSAFVMENVSMLRSDKHRFYMTNTDVPLVEKYKIRLKTTPILLLSREYAFCGSLDLVRNRESIEVSMWPLAHYNALNIIYKVAQNQDKLEVALKKHQKYLQKISKEHIFNIDGYVSRQSEVAFSSIESYYNGTLDLSKIKERIESAIMIQRMLSKAKEIFDNDILVDEYITSANGDVLANVRSYSVSDYLTAVLESEENGYLIKSGVLCAADFGAPQKRMRFVLMGIKREISSTLELPRGSFTQDNFRTVEDAIKDLEDVHPVKTLKEDVKGIPLIKKDLLGLAAELRNTDILRNHIVTETTEIAMERFCAIKQGENFHSLTKNLKTSTYTDITRTQNTIYLRLKYDEPSGTVVNVRKSMWIHPVHNRAISIREAARLQTFPDSFVFYGTKDKQYQQVGNAVPPMMAKAIALKLLSFLEKSNKEQ